jgi:hypothetical protein
VGHAACVEYSGAFVDHSHCTLGDSLEQVTLERSYAPGPCPRDQYDKSCDVGGPSVETDAGLSCTADETVWGHSTTWTTTGIPGFPACR